ncbi:hypothetical protein AB1I63_06820 [Streptococcus pneumoniae]
MSEKLKQNKHENMENFEMKQETFHLLKTGNCQLAAISELVSNIESLDYIFEKSTFEVVFPVGEHSALTYSYSFVNFKQAEIYWMKLYQSEAEQDRQYWLDCLANEKVFVLQVREVKM